MKYLVFLLAALFPCTAHAQQGMPNLPPNTVVGRMGSGVAGPAQAIPFATFVTQLTGFSVAGPASTTVGHIATWNNTTGTLLADGGAIPGAVLLLGGGGFNAYAGASCTNGAVSAIAAAGTVTCLANRATSQKQVASPAGPNSTSVFTMQGLAGTITPAVSGNVMITISGTVNESAGTAGHGLSWQISYGTSTAPTTNAALTGTQVGVVQQYLNPAAVTAADVQVPFSVTAVVTGLSVGTAYWIDLAAKAIVATDGSLVNVSVSAAEH